MAVPLREEEMASPVKRSEEEIFVGNHQNRERMKKSGPPILEDDLLDKNSKVEVALKPNTDNGDDLEMLGKELGRMDPETWKQLQKALEKEETLADDMNEDEAADDETDDITEDKDESVVDTSPAESEIIDIDGNSGSGENPVEDINEQDDHSATDTKIEENDAKEPEKSEYINNMPTDKMDDEYLGKLLTKEPNDEDYGALTEYLSENGIKPDTLDLDSGYGVPAGGYYSDLYNRGWDGGYYYYPFRRRRSAPSSMQKSDQELKRNKRTRRRRSLRPLDDAPEDEADDNDVTFTEDEMRLLYKILSGIYDEKEEELARVPIDAESAYSDYLLQQALLNENENERPVQEMYPRRMEIPPNPYERMEARKRASHEKYEDQTEFVPITYHGQFGYFFPMKRAYPATLSMVPGNKRSFYPAESQWGEILDDAAEKRADVISQYRELYDLANALDPNYHHGAPRYFDDDME